MGKKQLERQISKKHFKILVFLGFALLLGGAVLGKMSSTNEVPASELSLEEKFDQAMREGTPVFVFLHSLDCNPCQVMMETVAEVYPEFEDKIALIDVNVYDQENQSILRRERLQAIPTLVFYDGRGGRQVHIGVMDPLELQQVFQSLAG